jgi:uncharacterized membrane protein
MRTSTLLALFLTLSVLTSAIALAHAQNTTVDGAQTAVHDAYKALVEADSAGGDVNKLTDQLNLAVNLTSQAQALISADPQKAQSLASQAQAIAQNVTEQASSAKSGGLAQRPILIGASVTALLVGGILVYLFGPKVFWKVWLRLRKNYRVRTKNSTTQNKGLIITGEQVCAAILGVTIIIAFFAASQFILPKGTGEQFSELGILGPNMKLGDYPSEIVAGDTVNLNVYVGNQMGRPIYYIVMVKLGNNDTIVNPANITSIQQYDEVVPNNGTWNFPVNAKLTQAGINQRLIFELWIYNETVNQNQYHERWGQIWLNVTAPAS